MKSLWSTMMSGAGEKDNVCLVKDSYLPYYCAMDIILLFLPILLVGTFFTVTVCFIFHALSSPIPHKLTWLVLLLLAGPIGIIGYYFAVYEDKRVNKRPLTARVVWMIVLVTMSAVVGISLLSVLMMP